MDHIAPSGSHARPAEADLVVSVPFSLPPFQLPRTTAAGMFEHYSLLTMADLGVCLSRFYFLSLRIFVKRTFKTPKHQRDQAERYSKSVGNIGKRDLEPTLVYVIEAGRYIEVGIAVDMYFRFAVIQSSNPTKLTLAYRSVMMERRLARKIEVACHLHLINNHVHGEWFEAAAGTAIQFLETLTKKEPESVDAGPTQLRLVA